LALEDVAVIYDNHTVFENLSFTLQQGERLALVGGNGCGKSSILKLLVSEDVPHTGTVYTASNLIISYVPQNPDFLSGDLSNFAQAKDIDETLFRTILRKLDFSRDQFDKQLQDYSAGQKKKVLIAASLCQSAHVYIWDEPLNYLDVFSRMQIEELILTYQPTLLFVEHDRAFCENIATRTLNLAK